MFISDTFKQDVLSKNTQIVPIVIIEKWIGHDDNGLNVYDYSGFSTTNIDIEKSNGGNIYCKPLLMDLPKLKESINIESGKYQISSVTLSLSNIEYNGSRISDLFTNNLLMNENVSIYLKSQSCTTITPVNQQVHQPGQNVSPTLRVSDCLNVYFGKIRSIKHTDEKLTIGLEDLTEKKIHKDLPSEYMGDTDDVPDKYKSKVIPMCYGRMEKAPAVASYIDGNLRFRADGSRNVSQLHEEYYFDNENIAEGEHLVNGWITGAIRAFDGRYVSLLKYVAHQFVTEQFTDEDQTELNEEYITIPSDNATRYQYKHGGDNSVQINRSLLWSVDRIQGLIFDKPSGVNLIRTCAYQGTAGADGFGWYDEHGDMPPYGPVNYIDDVAYFSLTDNDSATGYSLDDNQAYFIKHIFSTHHNVKSDAVHVYILSWEVNPSDAKFSRLLRTTIDGLKLPVPGDAVVPNAYGKWLDNQDQLWVLPDNGDVLLEQFDNSWYNYTHGEDDYFPHEDIDISHQSISINEYEDVRALFTMSGKHGQDANTPPTTWENPNLSSVSYLWNDNAKIKFKNLLNEFNSVDDIPMDVCPALRFHMGKSSNNFAKQPANYYCIDLLGIGYSEMDNYGNWTVQRTYDYFLEMNINEIDCTSLVEYDKAQSLDYFLNVNGRTSPILDIDHDDNYAPEQTDYLENPIDIMRDILRYELGVTRFDSDEYLKAWREHHRWRFAFSVTDKINSKKLIEDISQSTMSFPRLKNNGDFGWVTLQRTYLEEDYVDAKQIESIDIINYNFKLTSANDIISKLDIQYGFDYATDKLSKIIKAEDAYFDDQSDIADMGLESGQPVMKFNNIDDSEDNKVVFETKYIQDKETAVKLKKKKYLNGKVQHLVVDLQLPLQYNELEVGSLIKFPKDELLDNLKAYGMDYTNPIAHGGMVRLPLFLVTEVQRSLDKIKVSCYQLHILDAPKYNLTDPYVDIKYYNSFWSGSFFPNANWIDPMYSEFTDEDYDFLDIYDPPTATYTQQMLIGYDSAFTSDEGVDYISSYERSFYIADNENLEGFSDDSDIISGGNFHNNMSKIVSINNFDILRLEDLIPAKNSDGSGYGSITTGWTNSSIGNFVAMELRMKNNDSHYIYSLRNIKSTPFDSNAFNPETVEIPHQINANGSELELGWVLYKSNPLWDYVQIYTNPNASDNYVINSTTGIQNNLDLLWVIGDTSHPSHFDFQLKLYPYYTPTSLSDLKLTYYSNLSTWLLTQPPEDFNQQLGILDVLILINMLIDGEYDPEVDYNNDNELNIQDVVLLVNFIMYG